MTAPPPLAVPEAFNEPIYAAGGGTTMSLRNLFDEFAVHGSLRVSDLHLKVGSAPVYRVDGELQPLRTQPVDLPTLQKIVRLLLSGDEWQTLQRDRSVDASMAADGMQFRLNCFFDCDGPAVAIRSLAFEPPAVESLGFPNNVWRDLVSKQHGLVLVTGITGAGKSTTIASLVNRIATTRPCRIITLEDPIEYPLRSQVALISQREIGREVTSFERGLRDCLREDPDVIFVGEMRDRESAAWTLTAAETGHLVFSTLHTRDTRGSITRLLDMFPSDRQTEVANQLSLGLSHIVSQKLVPRADGQGRVVAMEVLQNTYAVANLIRTGKLEQLYSVLQTKTRDVPQERMMTMERSLAQLVVQGLVASQEAEKWANDHAVFLDELRSRSRPAKQR